MSESKPREIRLYQTEDGSIPFDDWIAKLDKQKKLQAIIKQAERKDV